jgi:hypothetical protein
MLTISKISNPTQSKSTQSQSDTLQLWPLQKTENFLSNSFSRFLWELHTLYNNITLESSGSNQPGLESRLHQFATLVIPGKSLISSPAKWR